MDEGTIRVHLNKIFELIHKSFKIVQDFILLGELLKAHVSFGLDVSLARTQMSRFLTLLVSFTWGDIRGWGASLCLTQYNFPRCSMGAV